MKPADESRVRLIPVDRIRVVNPRVRDKAKFERFVESIAKLGLKKPITVTVGKPGDDGVESFDLVCGRSVKCRERDAVRYFFRERQLPVLFELGGTFRAQLLDHC